MPGFTFLLTNPRIYLEAKKQSERWSLSFDAKVERPERTGTFRIIFEGKEYDGYKMNGKVFIECYHPKNESEQLSPPQPDEWTLSTEERPGYIHVDTIPLEYQDAKTTWPRIGIVASLPSDPFLRLLQASVKTCSIELYASVPGPKHDEEGFSYGPDPDGRDIEWRSKMTDRARLDLLRVGITPRSNDALESEPSQEAKPQEPPSPMSSGAVDASKLVRAINRLFWAVVMIGVLLLIKAL